MRQFTDKKVDRETLEKIIDAARSAPTWKNSQTVRYVVVEDRQTLDRIADDATCGREANRRTIRGTQTLIALASVKGISGYEPDGSFTTNKGNEWQMFDAGIAAQTFMLAAHAYGVSSVVLGIFSDEKVSEILGLDDTLTVSALIPIGYAGGEPRNPPRKDLLEYIIYK